MKKIILENYTFASNTVRIQGEDGYLFSVIHNSDYNRTKKDADELGIEIVKRFNNYDKLKEDNALLLDALKSSQYYLETAINATPTGAIRNILTDANIAALLAIGKAESK